MFSKNEVIRKLATVNIVIEDLGPGPFHVQFWQEQGISMIQIGNTNHEWIEIDLTDEQADKLFPLFAVKEFNVGEMFDALEEISNQKFSKALSKLAEES